MKLDYKPVTINQKFITKPMFFFFWMPIFSSTYEKFAKEYFASGNTIDWNIGMLEIPKMFGYGKIGLASPNGDLELKGEYTSVTMKGRYNQFKHFWDQIMKDYPNTKEAYHFYKTNMREVDPEDNVTDIVFR